MDGLAIVVADVPVAVRLRGAAVTALSPIRCEGVMRGPVDECVDEMTKTLVKYAVDNPMVPPPVS
jgi:hypothetical protein